MVMKMPQDQTRLISWPSKLKRVKLAAKAERMERICWATTESTSMLMRLNSSKQPQAPVCRDKEKARGAVGSWAPPDQPPAPP